MLLPIIVLWSAAAQADSYFNPNFLSSDINSVADLSRFEKNDQQAPGTYRTDVYLNGRFLSNRDVRFVATDINNATARRAGGLTPCIDVIWLKQMGVNMAAFPALAKYHADECVATETLIPQAQIAFDFALLKLDISLPQAALNQSAEGYIPPEQWDNGIPALLFNYTFSGNNGTGDRSYYLNLQSGANVGAWRLRNTGAWRYSQGRGGDKSAWRNISTYVERAVIALKSSLILGDSNTNGELFGSTGFRGVRLFSAESMYPYSLQGYAPTVRGIARTHAKIVIRQNGYVIYQSYVPPGPFVINDMNPATASGNLNVTIEESDGSQQHYTVPYSAVPMLQREGRFKYDLVAGQYRSGSDEKSRPFFMQGSLIAGLRNGYTLYGGTQQAADYQAFMLGGAKNLGNWGALSLDITHARSRLADGSQHQGQSLRVLFAKSLNALGTNFQILGYRYSTQGFYTLDEVAYKRIQGYELSDEQSSRNKQPVIINYHNLRYSKKAQIQANISQGLGDYGSVYLSGNRQTYWHADGSTIWYQLGYANVWKGISYALSWSWNKSTDMAGSDRIVALNVSLPMSLLSARHFSRQSLLNRSYATFNGSQDARGGSSWQTGVGGTLLADNNLSYNFSQGHSAGNGESGSLSASWQTSYGVMSGGYNYAREQHQLNWQMSGGVVAHQNGVTFSQPLGDTNILVRAPGAAGVKVENQTGVRTDWRGYTVVPFATVYRYNRIALDINTLGDHIDIDNNVISVVPVQGALVRASFHTRKGVRALVTLLRNGVPLPFGSEVKEAQSEGQSLVGDAGQVYLSGMPVRGVIQARWGQSESAACKAPYQLEDDSLKKAVTQITLQCN
ncbi:fimbrial protein [Izhakiella australiensis]|uniref:Fimbrial protein n=1 Tax=Izhakiella australiensis TaxID=1926881 RepID=A0A1S8YPM4_9GAMM|nr:fimbrial protein [Izhakiella australiensis]